MYNVYLLSVNDGKEKRYKIGYTKNPVSQRVKQLKTGNCNEFEIEKVFESKWGTKIEAILHRKFSINRISGEWFIMSDSEVDNFVDDCKNLEEYFESTLKYSTFKNPKTFLI